jgi:hypothetical protein
MPDYSYITPEEVSRVCADIGISDWANRTSVTVDNSEAEIIRKIVGGEALDISLSDFRLGLEVELEHGTMFSDANVSNNHPILTGRIVLAHLKEGLDYYLRLNCMELEMELTGALVSRNAERAAEKRLALAEARVELETRIIASLR